MKRCVHSGKTCWLMDLFEGVLRMQGYPLSRAKALYGRLCKMAPAALAAHRKQQRWEIFTHHWTNNEQYRRKVGRKPAGWEELPIMTKKDFQRPMAQLLSRPYKSAAVYIGNTSGSSGHPFYYAKDKFCHALTWVQIRHLYAQYGLGLRSRQARFYGIPLRGLSHWKERAKDWVANRMRFPVFDLSEAVMRRWLERFRKNDFEYVYGYTSSLVRFARFCQEEGVLLKNLCPSLQYCIVTSELCTPEDREILEKGFGLTVVNEYGVSEVGLIAFENPQGRWKLCDELLYIEVVNEEGQPVSPGEPGQILATALYNRAMPFIRYQVGDVGVLERGADGQLNLKELVGRTNDFVRLPSGRVSPGLTFYYISRRLLEKKEFINEFIIRQTAPDTFEFVIHAKRPLTEADRQLIQTGLDEYLEPGLKLKITEVDHIERPKSGKIKHFYSALE